MYNTKYLNYLIAFSFYRSLRIVKRLKSIVILIFHRGKSEEETKMWLFFFLTHKTVTEKRKKIFQKISLLHAVFQIAI